MHGPKFFFGSVRIFFGWGGAGQEQRPLLAQQVLGRHVGQPEVRVGEHHQAAVVEAGPVRGEGAALGEVTLARDAPLPQVGGAPPAAPAAMTGCEDDDWTLVVRMNGNTVRPVNT